MLFSNLVIVFSGQFVSRGHRKPLNFDPNKKFSFSASLFAGLGSYTTQPTDSASNRTSRNFKGGPLEKGRLGRIRSKSRLMYWWPGDGKRARFERCCCPRVLSRRRRLYLLGTFAIEAARQLRSFSG